LLADEVGVGKTLSMAASALISALLDDGPVLILAPSTLTLQWQIEMKDKLGIPTAVWSSQQKAWLGEEGKYSPQNETPSPSRTVLIR
jgi:SNF2 family DNA or RNA helicase